MTALLEYLNNNNNNAVHCKLVPLKCINHLPFKGQYYYINAFIILLIKLGCACPIITI